MFYVPITSRFGQITIEVVSSNVKGLFASKTVETVLLSYSIPVPALCKEPFNSHAPFNLSFRVDQKHINEVVEPAMQNEWDASMGSRIRIQVEDMSNHLVMLMPNPNINITEDRTKIAEPKVKDIMLQVSRISAVIQFLNEIDQFERPLFFHKYPRLSKTYQVLLITFVWSFDPRYFLSYVIVFFMTLFSFGHKSIARKMEPILYNLYWKHPNKYFRPSREIKLVREFEVERDTEKIKKAVTEKLTKSEVASKKRKMPLQLEEKMIGLFKKVIPG